MGPKDEPTCAKHVDMCVGVCLGMRMDVCGDEAAFANVWPCGAGLLCSKRAVDIRIDICVDKCASTNVWTCVQKCVQRHSYRHVSRHVYRHVDRHVCRHA